MNPIPTSRTDNTPGIHWGGLNYVREDHASQLERENQILRSTLESYLGPEGVELLLKSFGALNDTETGGSK